MNKIWIKIKCLFGNHELEVCQTKEIIGTLFFQKTQAIRYKCKHCDWKDDDDSWSVTETL